MSKNPFPTLLTAFGLLALTLLLSRSSLAASSTVLISGLCYDTDIPNEPDEAIRLINVSSQPVTPTTWTLSPSSGAKSGGLTRAVA